MPLFKNKLLALEYPRSGEFNVQNQAEVRALVVWLEDTKIRFFDINDRKGLRIVQDPKWNAVFNDYLTRLGCPIPFNLVDGRFDMNEYAAVVDWILSHALSLEYRDGATQFNDVDVNSLLDEFSKRLLEIDYNTQAFHDGLLSIATSLGLSPVPNSTIHSLLNYILNVVKNKLNPSVIASKKAGSTVKVGDINDANVFPLGFSTGDKALDEAATILRLMYINDMRSLQTSVNELIVERQQVTANPSTDSRLGKVGK